MVHCTETRSSDSDKELERKAVLKIFNSDSFKKLMNRSISLTSKSTALSEVYRKEGNELFIKKSHDSSIHEHVLRLYTTSIAAADNDSEPLALAYGNRSALLFHFKKYEASVQDIDRGLKATKNNGYKIKLLCRKVKCLNALGTSENKKAMKAAESLLKKIEEKEAKQVLEELVIKTRATFISLKKSKQLPGENKILDSSNALYKKHKIDDFSGIEIKFNEKYGRHLIASKDYKPGDVIFIEKPYIKLISNRKIFAYCSHCCCETWSSIPCDNCTWIMFCSEKCKKNAWEKYHKYECSMYGCLEPNNKSNTNLLLAIRCLLLGIAEAGGIQKLKTELKTFNESNDLFKGFFKGKKIQSLGFKTVYNLANYIQADELSSHKVNTAKALKSMTKNNFFFGKNSDCEKTKRLIKNENSLFLGSLILRLSKVAQLNSHQMWNSNYYCLNRLDTINCWQNKCCSKGVYIASITSLLNHSCDPNVKKCYSNDHDIIVYAVQPIKKGSQLFDCYQLEYHEQNLSRKKNLSRNYNFMCDCTACVENWPSFSTLSKNENLLAFSDKQIELMINIRKELEQILQSIMLEGNLEFIVKHITQLGKAVETVCTNFNQPTVLKVKLITCLNLAFEKLYGINFSIPQECQYDL